MFYEKTTLPNGLNVVSEHIPGIRSVTLGIWFRVGSRDEELHQLGISHFMEHMMFKGTSTRSALDISMAFDGMGAELNAFTSKEYTCYYASVLDEHLAAALEILANMLQDSQFASDAIQTEREVVIEEIARYEDEPSDHVGDIFTEAMYPSNQLGRSILGTREIVGAFKHEDCAAYLKKHYHAGNAVIAAAGNIDHKALVALAKRFFGALPAGTANSRGKVEEAHRQLLTFEKKETEQAHLLYGMPGIPLGDPDRFAARLMETALGGPMSSRLFQEVREKRGLAYAVYAASSPYINASQFFIYVGTRPSNLEEVVRVLRLEIALLLERGVSAEELTRVQDYTVGHLVLASESTRDHMVRLGCNSVQDLEILSLDENIERFRSVSRADIERVATRVLSADPTVALISPLGKEEITTVFANA